MKRTQWTAGLVIALFMVTGTASAQPTAPGIYNPTTSTESTLYFHINGFQDFPVNTQKPSDLYADTVEVGLVTHSGCVVDPTGSQRFTDRSYHTWTGYSSPSYVQYDVDENGLPRIHQERGLSYDIVFDQGVEPVFRWFLEGKSPGSLPGTDQFHPPIPDVVVRATVREGDDVSVGNEAFNQGEIVAQGESIQTTLAGGLTQANENVIPHQVDGAWVYEFVIPLDLVASAIDKRESYNVRVDAFVKNDLCGDPSVPGGGDYIFPNFALVHTSSEYRPRMTWNIMNPIIIEALHPQFVGDDLIVHTYSNSPYGSYDVLGDLKSEQPIVVEIEGPSPAINLAQVALVDHSLGHGPEEHFKAVAATFLWDYKGDQAKDGTYTVTLKVQNDQQTAEAFAVATFNIGAGDAEVCAKNFDEATVACTKASETQSVPGEDSPGVGWIPIAGALAIAAIALRRRP